MWRGSWSQDICVFPVKKITDKVGIWEMPHAANAYVWILQKHPGLEMLADAETERREENEDNEGEGD